MIINSTFLDELNVSKTFKDNPLDCFPIKEPISSIKCSVKHLIGHFQGEFKVQRPQKFGEKTGKPPF